jgi:hypothetical protein
VQREQFSRALEAAHDQLRLVSQVRDPREFASAQAHLVQGYGQQYVDSVNEAVDVISSAWEDYGNQAREKHKCRYRCGATGSRYHHTRDGGNRR